MIRLYNVPGLKLFLGDSVYTIPAESLCMEDKKTLAVSKIWYSFKSNKVVLGNPWFKNFFTALNFVSNEVIFAVSALQTFG
jgi:hypothetical protein